MPKVRVKLVKYDMDKTKKRNRKNFLVEAKNERAIIFQLERIHKGEKVEEIHEIVWDEEQIIESNKQAEQKKIKTQYGEVKFFDSEKGFGFITPDDEGIEDLFFHESATGGHKFEDYDRVSFEVSEGPKGPCAIHIKFIM